MASLVPPVIAVAQAARFAVQKTVERGLALYTALTAGQGLSGAVAALFQVDDFRPSRPVTDYVTSIGRLTEEQVKIVCPRLPKIRELTDRTARSLSPNDYPSPREYGTAVHTTLRHEINAMGDPDLKAEVSFFKSRIASRAGHGMRDTVRIDVLENTGDGTVCVYDIKTGGAILKPVRAREIANAVYRNYPNAKRIIVTEVKPRE